MNQKTDQESAQQLAEQVAAIWSRDNTPQLAWNGPVINKGEQI